jgi:L-ascorbate metabolism protein UlaG (beta-lactamase superfamily)
LRRAALALAVLTIASASVVLWRLLEHPSIEVHAGTELPLADAAAPGVRARFMGCTTVLLDDGETQLLVDGFFSRPGGLRVLLGRIAPDETRIDAALARAGIESLAAVMTAHSHYDHAMDAPLVAQRTGALLIGSASTAMIARGVEFPEGRLRVVAGGERLEFGAFTLTVLSALHTPGRGGSPGEIEEPLRPPARHGDYREGGCYSFHFAHPAGSVLVHPSTNFVPGRFADLRADVLFLGTATLGRQSEEFVREWWRETALACGARLVIPIHWDDFVQPLDEPLQPMPALMDDFELGMRRLGELARESGVALGRMPLFDPVLVLPPSQGR